MTLENSFIIVYIPHPDKDSAIKTAIQLVENKLIACANIVDEVTSVYHFKGKAHLDPEAILIGKTIKSNFEKIKEFISLNHPYDVPCVISFTIHDGNAPYLNWIKEELSK